MKNIVKSIYLMAFFVFTFTYSKAQWTQTSLSNGDALYLLPSGSGGTTSAVGIGAFNGSNPSAYLHINSNLQPASNTGFNGGQVFRTSGPSGVDHQWRMYNDNSSSNTEKFNVTNPSGTDNVELKAITGAMKFYTDGTQRMCITPASSSGYIAIGAGFNAPKSKVHVHQGGNTNVQFQMTTANTGSSNATDGLGIGIM